MQLFANNVTVFVRQSVAPGDTVITLDDTSKLPAPTGGDFFTITFYQVGGGVESNWEIVKVTAVSGNDITCVRGIDDTNALSWPVGSIGQMRSTKALMEDLSGSADSAATNAAEALSSANAASAVAAQVTAQVNALGVNLGYAVPVTYAGGISLTLATQTVEYLGEVYAPILSQLPFTTSGTFETAKFRLIQGVTTIDLAAPSGGGMVGFQDTLGTTYLKTVSDMLNGTPVSVMRFIDTTKHAAIYDGSTVYDATANIQTGLTAMPNNSSLVLPRGLFRHGNVQIPSKTNFSLLGNKSRHLLTGTGVNGLGFELVGTLAGLDISGLVIVGDGVKANKHKGVWCNSGQTLAGVDIHHMDISQVINGVSLNANLGGSIDGGTVAFNRIYDIVGIASGEGYGVHIAKQSSESVKTSVVHNQIARCGRHAIYFARGADMFAGFNTIWGHRSTLTAGEIADATDGRGKIRPAILVARSAHVGIQGNRCINGYDGAILVAANPDNEGGVVCFDVAVNTNFLTQPQNTVPLLMVGDANPAVGGFPEDVSVSGNTLYADGVNLDQIRHNSGKNVRYRGNHVTVKNVTATTACMEIRSSGDAAGATLYNDNVVIVGNDFHGTTSNGSTVRGLRVDATAAASGASIEIAGNPTTGDAAANPVFEAAAVTNANYRKRSASGKCRGVYTAADTAPSVARGITDMIIANAGAVSITTLAGADEGQTVTLKFSDANTTIVNATNMRLAGGANFVSTDRDLLTLEYLSGTWYERARSLN